MKKALCMLLSLMILISAFGGLTAFAADAEEIAAAAETDALPEVPQVRIETASGEGLNLTKAIGYVDATVTITDTDGTEIKGEAQVKVRGNSTSGLNKKPYTFKFSKKTNVLGMGKAKKWALLANMFDPTLLRNYVGIEIARELGMAYTSEQRVVEVWMDGSFRGCYNLIEPVQEGSSRVDIDIESNGGMKDFLIERELNHIDEGAVYFTSNGIRFVCDEPESPNTEQLAYIKDVVDSAFQVLRSGTRKQVEEKIDLTSFARYYLLNEFVKTVDFDYSSVFFYYKDGKMYAGPAWDYDLSMGNENAVISANYAASNKTDGLHCDTKQLYRWLCKRVWFFDAVRREWEAHRAYFESIGADGGMIDSLYESYSGAIDRNFSAARWPFKHYFNYNRAPDATYAENLAYFKNWTSERASWLGGYFDEDVIAYLLGDADGDGLVSILDATAIQRMLASFMTDGFDSIAADTDGDGTVTVFDVSLIQRRLADMEVSDPVGEQLWRK